MLKRDYGGQTCSTARTLEIVGERWTLLILCDLFLGVRRFDQLQASLGVARNVLTDRLNAWSRPACSSGCATPTGRRATSTA